MTIVDPTDKKEEIWLSHMTKAPTCTEKQKQKAPWQQTNTTKNVNYSTIAHRLKPVSCGSDFNTTGVVKPVNGILTLPLTTTFV